MNELNKVDFRMNSTRGGEDGKEKNKGEGNFNFLNVRTATTCGSNTHRAELFWFYFPSIRLGVRSCVSVAQLSVF